jgi:hypothetical protein
MSPMPWIGAAIGGLGGNAVITRSPGPRLSSHQWTHLRHDLVHAFRSVRKTRPTPSSTILTLALGIGANTAIFSVVNGVLLKPLPYPEPARLLFITSQFPGSASISSGCRRRNSSSSGAPALVRGRRSLPRRGSEPWNRRSAPPRQFRDRHVGTDAGLGVQPIAGASSPGPIRSPAPKTSAVLSSEIWQSDSA